jgi:O-6-methylguanine DNA methyltransferase
MRADDRLYACEIAWEGWRFLLLSRATGVRYLDLRGTSLSELERRLGAEIVVDDPRNAQAVRELEEYLAGTRRAFSSRLDVVGTPFQREVWAAVSRIPYGVTTSYGEIAAAIGRPQAARAVGAAVGANPIPIFVPCHRVLGKDGCLVGFGGGLPLKERLLALEKGDRSPAARR